VSTVLASPRQEIAPEPATTPASAGRGFAAWLVRWRLALRMARRDARRSKGRTVLVLLMVGLPVLAIVGADTLNRTNDLSAVEALPSRLGAADARIEGVSRAPIVADPTIGEALSVESPTDEPWTAAEVRAALPDGVQLVEQEAGMIALRTGIGYATVEAFAEDADAPLRAGAYEVVAGRIALRDGEVAVSEAVAGRGIEVGDRIELTRDEVAVDVVGVVRSGSMPGSRFVVLPPEAADLVDNSRPLFFAGVPGGLDWPAVQQLNEQGLVALSRVVLEDPPAPEEYLPPEWGSTGASSAEIAVIALVVAALLLEVVLLAGPAFAVGLRRQRRDLALLAAAGGTPADLRRSVLASGLLLGGGAAVAGALAGVGAARAAVPVFESWGAGFGPFEVAPLAVVAVVSVGAVAGLAAAWVPARQAARTDVVTSLTGRRGQVRSSRRLPVVGLVVAAAGLVLTVLGARGTELAVAGGAVLLVVGVVLATPWLVGLLSPLASRLPVAGRLAVRDATRNRTRTAPAVAAVMATVAGITAMAIGSASDSAQGERDYVPSAPMGMATVSVFDADQEGWAAVRATVEQRLPGRDVSEIRGLALWDADAAGLQVTTPDCAGPLSECGWYPVLDQAYTTTLGDVAIGEPAAIAAVTPEAVRAEVLAALEAGRVVVFGPDALDAAGQVRLDGVRYTEQGIEPVGDGVSLPATEVVPPPTGSWVTAPANVVVPEALADRLPVPTVITQLVVGDADDPLTEAEETTLTESVALLSSESSVYVERGWSDDLWVARLLLLAVGGTLVLVATLTATGLAVADARPDHATLGAVGAAPRTRRLMAMGSAGVIGAFGAVLGVLAGIAPGVAVAYPLTSTDYGSGAQPLVVVPWDLLAALAVGVPLLAVLVTGLAVRSRLPMAQRMAG
jgi:putative ABC transport system permease protein